MRRLLWLLAGLALVAAGLWLLAGPPREVQHRLYGEAWARQATGQHDQGAGFEGVTPGVVRQRKT